jgi:hypothetical protein
MTLTLRPNNAPNGPYAEPERCEGCGRQIPEFVVADEQVYHLRVDEYRAEGGKATAWMFCPECGTEAVSFLTDSLTFPEPDAQPDVDLADPPLKGSPCGFCGDAIEGVARAVAYEAGTGFSDPSAAGYVCDGCAGVVQNFLEMVPETPPDGETYWPPALIEAESIAEPPSDTPERIPRVLDRLGDIALDGPQFDFRALSRPTDYRPGRYVEGSATAERINWVENGEREVKRLRATVDDWAGYIPEDELNSIRIEWPIPEGRSSTAQAMLETSEEGYTSDVYTELGPVIGLNTDLDVPAAPPEHQDNNDDGSEPGSASASSIPPSSEQRDDPPTPDKQDSPPTPDQREEYVAPERTAAEQMRRLADEQVESIFGPVLARRDTFKGAADRLVLAVSVDHNVGLTGYVATHVEGVDQDGARVAYSDADEVEVDEFHEAGEMDWPTLELILGSGPITADRLITLLYETFLYAAEKREEAHPHPPIALDGFLFPEDLSGPEGSADPTEPAEDPWEHPFPPEQQVSVGEITPESAVERLAGMDLDTPLSNLTCAAPPDQCERATVTTERHPMGDHRVVDNHQVPAGETVRVAVTVDPPLGSQYGGRDAEWRARSVWHRECAPSAEEFGDGYSLGEQSFAGFYVEGTVQEGPTETYTEAGQDYEYQPLLLTDPEVLCHRIRAERAD